MDVDVPASLSKEQFNQLMQMLNSQQHPELNDSHTDPHTAMMAGKFFCLLSCSDLKWLLDSGATDHICSDL